MKKNNWGFWYQIKDENGVWQLRRNAYFISEPIKESKMKHLRTFWPMIVAIIGALIMIFAGVNDCRGCTVKDALLVSMETWGWIGAAMVAIAILFGLWWIVKGVLNLIDDYKGFNAQSKEHSRMIEFINKRIDELTKKK